MPVVGWLVAVSYVSVVIIQAQAGRDRRPRELSVMLVVMVNFMYNLLGQRVPQNVCKDYSMCICEDVSRRS